MTIVYSLIARGQTVLAEYTHTGGNFQTVTRLILDRISDQNGKMSYVYDQYVFHYICEDKLVYLCMCDDMAKRRIPFAFLEDVGQRFRTRFGSEVMTAIAFAMNDEFSGVLQRQMEFYNSPAADNFKQVADKLEDVKNIMVENVDKILERGEKLELLVDKTDQLQLQAFKFEKSSRKLKNVMYWKKVKFTLAIAFAVAFCVWAISAMACGVTYKKCRG